MWGEKLPMCPSRKPVRTDACGARGHRGGRKTASAVLPGRLEKHRRKIRRVARRLRARAVFRPRARVGLDHLAVEVPGRVAEHRQDDGKAEEERKRADEQQ